MATTTQTNGVLPITASQAASKMQKPSHTRAAGPKLKVVVRRLAPALTEAEFTKILGDEWKSGGGRVDWASYKPGKDSKDPSKVSRPSRAYLHLTNEAHLIPLSNHVRQLTFEDAANTFTSSCLLGPPSVEYAPYGRIPSGKRRTDARQGTIDLDPEFMDFLESLANPVSTKEEETEAVAKAEKVTTTPLVQFLKEKKASKTKEIAVAKASKHTRQETQASFSSAKTKAKEIIEEQPKKTAKETKKERLVEKAAREAVKVLNREAAAKTAALAQAANAPPAEAPKNPRVVARERGSIAAAARILQRDLGLSPGNAHRRAKVEAEAAKSETPSTPSAQQGPKAGPAGKGKSRGAPAQPTENGKPKEAPPPIVLLKKPAEAPSAPSQPTPPPAPAGRPSTPASRPSTAVQPPTTAPPTAPAAAAKPPPAPSGRKPQPLPVPTPGATRAFVKHANPSQGVTEPLLKEAMETFGAVSHVEIDKRKGFAYVDFVESEGLRKAMAANPTKIAQGTVQVLERKDTKPVREPPGGPRGPFAGARGGGGAGAGGGGRGGGRRGRGGRGAAGGAAAGEGAAAGGASVVAPSGPAAVGK